MRKRCKNTIIEKLTKLYFQKANRSYTKEIEQKLSRINPGKRGIDLLSEYYYDKIRKIIITSMLLFLLIFTVSILYNHDSVIKDGGIIKKNTYGQGDIYVELVAKQGNKQYLVPINVNERKYTPQETMAKMDELSKLLIEYIRGDNESLSRVVYPLKLPVSVPEYPFNLTWKTDNYLLILDNGKLGENVPDEKGSRVTLSCEMEYEGITREYKYEITMYPIEVSVEDRIKNEIISSIHEAQEVCKYDELLQLPNEGSLGIIKWSEAKIPVTIIMAILSGIVLVGIWVGNDNDLSKEYGKRNRSLNLEYSEFVSKLQLLISSGMTLRAALWKMGDDYKKQNLSRANQKYVYEELLICIGKMRDGVSEESCLELFGKRCGLIEYHKLTTLLMQNLKKGNRGLVEALSNETRIALEQRKMLAKRLGEEAQTKLLFPMIIMLCIVMVIIMIPAYISFGI